MLFCFFFFKFRFGTVLVSVQSMEDYSKRRWLNDTSVCKTYLTQDKRERKLAQSENWVNNCLLTILINKAKLSSFLFCTSLDQWNNILSFIQSLFPPQSQANTIHRGILWDSKMAWGLWLGPALLIHGLVGHSQSSSQWASWFIKYSKPHCSNRS